MPRFHTIANGSAAPFATARPTQAPPKFEPWTTTLALFLLTVQGVLRPESAPAHGDWLAATWLMSIGAFVWSVLRTAGWQPPRIAMAWHGLQTHRREVLGVGLLVALAFGLRTYDLEHHPYAFVNDEGELGREAWRIKEGLRTNFFETGWAAQPVWSFVPASVGIAVFGNTAFAVRLISAVAGTLSAVFLYLLAREAFDRTTAFLATGLLATLPLHMHFSRLGVNNVFDAFFATGVLWLTYRALRRGRIGDYLWAGLAAGLTLYTYLGSRLVMALAGGMLAYAALDRRGDARVHRRHLLAFAGALIVVAAPMATYFGRHPDEFMARLNADGILNNGWLQKQAADGEGYLRPLLTQLRKSSLVVIARPAPYGFFNSPRPYLAALTSLFFTLGLGYSVSRLKEPCYLLACTWFGAVILFGGALTTSPPASQRLIMSAPAIALIAAIGLRQAARLAQSERVISGRLGLALCAGVVVISGWQGVRYYFGEYRQGHYFSDPANEISYEAGRHAAALGPDYTLYLIGEPGVHATFANFSFLAPDADVQDFNAVTPGTVGALPRERGAFFVAIPARRADLDRLALLAPGGRWLEVPRRYQAPEVLYYAYVIPPGWLMPR